MNKLKVILSLCLITMLTVVVISCGDDEEPETLPPVLNFSGGNAANVERNASVTIGLSLTAQAGIKSLTVNGTPVAGVTVGSTTQTLDYQYTVASTAAFGPLPLEFALTDNKDRIASSTFTVTVIGSTINLSSLATDGVISTAVTLEKQNTYYLDRRISIANGGILTINPGTVIYAKTTGLPAGETLARLLIETSGKIVANGSVAEPIVFTSEKILTNNAAPGDWEGLRVNGSAGTDQGSLRYARIEFAGIGGPSGTSAGQEAAVRLNGVTAFVFEFVQVFRSAYEGILYRSGTTIHIKNIIATNCEGRGFHFRDAASQGTGQFLIVHPRNLVNLQAAETGEGSAIDIRQSTNVNLANITILGPGRVVEGSTMDGIRVWSDVSSGSARIFNSLIAFFPDDGVRIDPSAATAVDGDGNPVFTATPMFAFNHIFQLGDEMLRGNANAQVFATNAGFGNTLTQDATPAVSAGITVDSYVPSATITSTNNPSSLGAPFVSAAYVGAIGATDWTAGGWAKNPNGNIRP
ncbi:MAG: hypothetical protein KF725_12830 [Cyclobacteriaceae bacterium]|nr:hypothetical protein [Cyclobacteriaceae bacterium]UYN85487.1 MAG: hypothetical protein KIT51_11385 [Cyclobacteriaceae bacterium]